MLRAEIRDLQFRHEVEIALLHSTYLMVLNGPGEQLPSIEKQVELLRKSPLYNEAWYLNTYPDVAKAAVDPAEHYIRAGGFEGRNPGPNFDSMGYYLSNADAAHEGWPALVHYLLSDEHKGGSSN